jgi:hypothetical protein
VNLKGKLGLSRCHRSITARSLTRRFGRTSTATTLRLQLCQYKKYRLCEVSVELDIVERCLSVHLGQYCAGGRRLLACVLTRLGIAVDELDVHVTPYSTARPVRTFAQLGLDKRLLAEIFAAGYERPTPIQAQTVPIVLSGSDVIALAKTGTG